MTDEELRKKYPEIMALRQFKTPQEIMEALKVPGTEFWHGESVDGKPWGLRRRIAYGVGTYGEFCKNKPDYFPAHKDHLIIIAEDCKGNPNSLQQSCRDFSPSMVYITGFSEQFCNAFFTDPKQAEVWFAAVEKAFMEDVEWQEHCLQIEMMADCADDTWLNRREQADEDY